MDWLVGIGIGTGAGIVSAMFGYMKNLPKQEDFNAWAAAKTATVAGIIGGLAASTGLTVDEVTTMSVSGFVGILFERLWSFGAQIQKK